MNSANFKETNLSAKGFSKTFSNAIVVMSRSQIVGVINIDNKIQLWDFEPNCNSHAVLVLNEQGLALKEEILK